MQIWRVKGIKIRLTKDRVSFKNGKNVGSGRVQKLIRKKAVCMRLISRCKQKTVGCKILGRVYIGAYILKVIHTTTRGAKNYIMLDIL